jgi:hypothetical protein
MVDCSFCTWKSKVVLVTSLLVVDCVENICREMSPTLTVFSIDSQRPTMVPPFAPTASPSALPSKLPSNRPSA